MSKEVYPFVSTMGQLKFNLKVAICMLSLPPKTIVFKSHAILVTVHLPL